jgi:3-methyladenine DNA glycosylase AlkC
MAEPLKEMFNAAYYERLIQALVASFPRLDADAFRADMLRDLHTRELNARMRHTSAMIRKHVPGDFRSVVEGLKAVAGRMPKGYTALLYPDFIGLHGLDDAAYSLDALRHFTSYGSSEFAVREFFRRDVPGTLAVMTAWAEDDSEHVRRLASEGSRSRLPWSFRLEAVLRDPSLTRPILERLRTDTSLYVRKSVANHLNDFSKDHPAYMLGIVGAWDQTNPHTAWIVKQGCRTLVKQGHADALAVLAFEADTQVQVEDFSLSADRLRLGEVLAFSFILKSAKALPQQLVVDYAIHYVKANGQRSKKVFKLKDCRLAPAASIAFVKRQRIIDMTTRKHHPGMHRLEILINGQVAAAGEFELVL